MKTSPEDIHAYLSIRSALIDYATPIIGCRARAEDLVQEAFIRFSLRREQGYSTRQPMNKIVHPQSYLYRVVRNLAFDWLRRPDAATVELPPEMDEMEAALASPEQQAIQQDQLEILNQALAELPERKRTAFIMHRVQGMSLQQVADHLGVSVVRVHQMVKEVIVHGASRLDADG